MHGSRSKEEKRNCSYMLILKWWKAKSTKINNFIFLHLIPSLYSFYCFFMYMYINEQCKKETRDAILFIMFVLILSPDFVRSIRIASCAHARSTALTLLCRMQYTLIVLNWIACKKEIKNWIEINWGWCSLIIFLTFSLSPSFGLVDFTLCLLNMSVHKYVFYLYFFRETFI